MFNNFGYKPSEGGVCPFAILARLVPLTLPEFDLRGFDLRIPKYRHPVVLASVIGLNHPSDKFCSSELCAWPDQLATIGIWIFLGHLFDLLVIDLGSFGVINYKELCKKQNVNTL